MGRCPWLSMSQSVCGSNVSLSRRNRLVECAVNDQLSKIEEFRMGSEEGSVWSQVWLSPVWREDGASRTPGPCEEKKASALGEKAKQSSGEPYPRPDIPMRPATM